MGRPPDTPGPERAAFERDGYLIPIHLMVPREMAEVRRGLEEPPAPGPSSRAACGPSLRAAPARIHSRP